MMTPYTSCILFLADGARPDVMENLLSAGDLPNMQRYILEEGSYRQTVTAFPSTTGPAYIPFLTGRYPGVCNVPGIRWFDREAYARGSFFSLRRFRSYVGPGSYMINYDLDHPAPTLFEVFERPVNIFSPINRGSGFRGNKTKALRSVFWLFGHFTRRWQIVDRFTHRFLKAALDDRPDFVYAVFPGIDTLSHLSDPFAPEVIAAYRTLDATIGEVALALKRAGTLNQTLFIVASDHGLTATHTHFDLACFMERKGFKTLHYPNIFRNGVAAAVMVSGNAMAHVYVKNGHGWAGRAFHHDLRNGKGDLVADLVAQEGIALVATLAADGNIVITSRRGEATLCVHDGKIEYRVRDGDPFGYPPLPAQVTDRESLEATFETEYPDALAQCLQIFKAQRCGDLVLSAEKGFDLRAANSETPAHKSSHGSLHREHMHVPLLINHPVAEKAIRTVDIFPSILQLMGVRAEGETDGIRVI